MVKYGCCFPGQGSQKQAMAIDLFENSKTVQELFELASDAAGLNIFNLLAYSNEQTLQQTENAQLAITVANRSAAILLEEGGIKFSCTSGSSLGELSAYAASKVISEYELFKIVQKRGQLMATATTRNGELGMAAVIGIGFEKVEGILKACGAENLYLSNDNGPTQVVIAGNAKEIEKYSQILKAEGARKVVALKVSGPFHTPFMGDSQQQFALFLEQFKFNEPQIPLYLNVTGKLAKDAKEVKSCCIEQITKAVRWTTIMESMVKDKNVDVALEVGPGTVISGLWRNSGQNIACHSLGTYKEIQDFLIGRD
ncbi:MAG: ACP S-malonyltransferase [Sphaerochaetaceae bacterium]